MQAEQIAHVCVMCGHRSEVQPLPVTVIIPASVEKQILDRMNRDGRVEVRLLEEDTENGCAWTGEVIGWENPDGGWGCLRIGQVAGHSVHDLESAAE